MSTFMLIREASDRTALYVDDQDDDDVVITKANNNNKSKPSARMPTVMEESNLRDSMSSKGSVTFRAIRPRMGKTPSQLLGQLMGTTPSAKTSDKSLTDSQEEEEEYYNPLYASSDNPLFGK